jgi:hypothetical protein
LKVPNCGRTAKSYRDDVIILKVEDAAALYALAAVALEHRAPNFTCDRLTPFPRARRPPLIDIQQHVRPV